MAKLLQLRGGTTSEHSSFTGASKEVTVDTTKKTAIVHDGATAGGNTNSSVHQNHGILFNGNSHKRFNINAVDCTDNETGGIGWQTSGDNVSSSSKNFIQNCPGYSTGQTTFP